MSDFKNLTISLDREAPWKSRIEIDGQPITNIFAVRIEQKAPDQPLTVELSTYGDELVINGHRAAEIILRSYCPVCKEARGAYLFSLDAKIIAFP